MKKNKYLPTPHSSSSLSRVSNSISITEKLLADKKNRDRQLAEYYFLQGEKREPWERKLAIEDFTKAIDLDTTNYRYYSSRGLAKYYSDDLQEAIKDYKQAISLNPIVDLFTKLADIYSLLNNYEEAVVQYRNAIDLNPESADLFYKRGVAKLHLKLFESSYDDFTKSIELKDPNHPSDEAEWGSYYRRGLIKLVRQNYEEAIQDFNKSIQLSTQYYIPVEETELAQHYEGIAKFHLQDYLGALESFTGAIWHGERYGSALYRAKEDPAGRIFVEPDMVDVLGNIWPKEYPNNANSHYNRAIVNKLLNSKNDSESDFERTKRILKNANRSNL